MPKLKSNHHHKLGNEIDLEMLAPELLGNRHREFVMQDLEHTGKNSKFLVLKFDVKGMASFEEMKRSDVLKLTQEEAKSMTDKLESDQKSHTPMACDGTPSRVLSPRRTKSFLNTPINGFCDIQDVHMRDLRKMDTTFATTNEPFITVRKQAILIKADPLRTIIMRNACLVFIPDGADSLISTLKEKFHELVPEAEKGTAYEFRALEAVLYTLCKLLHSDCNKTFPVIISTLDRLATVQMTSGELETLRTLKNTINDFGSQVEGIRRVLTELLDNEEDLHLLYLTMLNENPDLLYNLGAFDSEEAEILLESYLQEIYTIRTKVTLLQHRIQNTESVVMLKLDSTRNHLLAVDVVFSLITVSLTFVMFVTGAFGMNLNSGLEQSTGVFSGVILGCVLVCIVIVALGLWYFRRKGVLMI